MKIVFNKFLIQVYNDNYFNDNLPSQVNLEGNENILLKSCRVRITYQRMSSNVIRVALY